MCSDTMTMSAEAVTYLYHHVVLPPELPQRDDNNAAHERSLFEMVIQALKYLMTIVDKSYINTVTSAMAMIENLRDNRDVHGNVSEVQLETLLSDLVAGNTCNPVPLEIKAQNAGIVISRQKEHLNFEFFELSPINKAALHSTRLIRTFPGHTSRIPVDRMMNTNLRKSLVSTIAKMATQSAPGFQPQAHKNGKDEDENRDTTAPDLVTEFLMTMITVIGEATDVNRITKATREDVLWNDGVLPWRRSPLWLLVRVSLQLWFDRNATKLRLPDSLYKAFMICMVSQLLETARVNWKTLHSETVHNISAKLIRRLRKFEILNQADCLRYCWAKSIKDNILNAHTVIAQHWQGLTQNPKIDIDTTAVISIQPDNDLDMKLPALDAFLSAMRARQHDRSPSKFRPSSVFPSFSAASLPESVIGPNAYKYFHLAAFEVWVDQQLQSWISLHLDDPSTCGELRRLITHYFTTASAAYVGSPISMSLMYLTLAELWIACDRSACAQYSLLPEYDNELYITEFQCLVLPLKHHMRRLHEVERYIQSRRKAAMSHLPSVYRSFGHKSSFAVRYFEASLGLQSTLIDIERDAEKKRTQKCQELDDLKTKHDDLMNQYNSASCDTETYVYNRRYGYTKNRHPGWCHRCSYKEQAEALRIHIYEWPVSSDPSIAKATIFELKIPQGFSDWRDASAFMISEVLCHRNHNAEKPHCSYTLSGHQDLSHMLSPLYYKRRIVPLSNVKPYNVTHRKHKKSIPHLTVDDVCLKNALQYAYFDTALGVFNEAAPTYTEDLPKLCIYHMPQRSKVLDRFMYHPPSSPDGTPPNEVIASLSDCPVHLSLEEYKALGTMPFGNQIVYSNILTQLATSTTDLTRVESQCLILQIIQQVSLPSEDVERERHAVVVDEFFGHAMLEQLEIGLQRMSENWESWRAAASFSLLARRILSLTESPKACLRALEYLVRLRSVCFKWLQRLKAKVSSSADDEQRNELTSRATEIALLCAGTYDVEDIHLNTVLQQDSSVSMLIQSSITVQENCDLVESEDQALYQSFLQSHRAMMYRAFGKLRSFILQDSTGLCEAVMANWAVFDPSIADDWYSLEQPQHHWLATNFGTLLVHFNLLTAELLVDGLPLARLPSTFMQHEIYKPLFSRSMLEVIPTGEPGLEFSARYVYRQYKLHFGMQDSDMLLVAVQGGSRLDLIPSRVFHRQLPHAFMTEFIHWYDHTNDEVVFRPRQAPWISGSDCWHLKHDNQTKNWRLVQGRNVLVSLTSTSAETLSTLFQSVEETHHIHVVLNIKTRSVEIDLPRLQLGFFVERNSQTICSRQFRGMLVDSQQSIGTLVGLTSKLVLKGQSERMILIPVPREFGMSSINYAKSSSSDHVTVKINKDDATKVYAYNLDEDLGRITDSGDLESKLLISYLHAVTSSCLPDPLTKMTGTEAALQILQSAAVRSFSLLTHRNVKLLVQIATLSTKRSFYPIELKEMQQVLWNRKLPALSQHPHFRMLVNQIFDHAASMQVFDPKHDVFAVIRDARKLISSDLVLDRRSLIRTTTFHATALEAEQFTIVQDEEYFARDSQQQSERSERATIAATMVLRSSFALHRSTPNLKDILLRLHFSNKTVEGIKSPYIPSSLGYDSKWLGDASTHLIEMWCSLHQSMATVYSSDDHVFDIMIWLSTMAYAKSADMDVIQALAALNRDPEFAEIHLPSAPSFNLAAGDTWLPNEVKSIVARNLFSFDNSAESRLPKAYHETEQQHLSRVESLFGNRQNTAIQSFVAALQRQWPVRGLETPTSAAITEYVNVPAAMKDITAKCEDWYDNREFSRYLDEVSRLCARQRVLIVDQPHYILSMPIKLEALSYHLRKFSPDDVFAAKPPSMSRWSSGQAISAELAMPSEPTILVAAQFIQSNGSDVRERLEKLCCSLQDYAMSRTEKDYVEQLRASCSALNEQVDSSLDVPNVAAGLPALLEKYLCDCKVCFEDFNRALAECVTNSHLFSDRVGLSTDHLIRLSPQFWLSQLHRDRFHSLSDMWKSTIINYGVFITHLHRAQRLVALSNTPVDLYEELRHIGHSNWSPFRFPETLLLEAESGILVRREQELIASYMRTPRNGDNIVLQLLMGGGKSSTIVPILVTDLTDKEKLVRVISAKAQSQQMLQMLISKLGGLLNRRIYHMPFSRSLRLSSTEVEGLRKLYKECVENRGVLLIQPEHILSFKLMAVESVLTDQPELAQSMLATQAYFDNVTRDIIDEVDENLSVKFELIYTMGSQRSIDFAPERWLIIQQVLGLLPQFAIQVQEHLPGAIDVQNSSEGKFPRIRLLRKEAADRLLESLAQHVVDWGLSGLPTRSQSDDMRAAILRYIKQPEIERGDIDAVEKSKFWSDDTMLPLLLVRGLIAGGVLRFTLSTKRWRVNYGLDTTRTPSTALAVPYRSKDSPNPRSEFSHTDVVLILTLLSHYYGGLSDEQLFDTLTHVLNSDQRDIEYEAFVRTASPNLPTAFQHLSGVSIRDRHQCMTEVFPALRYSKNAIDYYLAHLVFPKQCKQFPQKLSASGWDLGKTKTHSTTGFSGTNDTLHLLPLEVKHLDLLSQSHTNAQVLGYLLQDETSVELLPQRTNNTISDGEHLLTIIQSLESDVRVILDCGASILELNNREVAKTWLQMRKDSVEAVVYFEDERLSVLDRNGRIESFQTSPYVKQLDSCIVYLDESHTRGTDLKLPRHYRAVATLGARLTKDRLTQACMRLRKLGHGQSITFIVPEEIAIKIRELTAKSLDDSITVNDVICWSISETWHDLKRSMPLWAVQGQRFENHKHLLNGINTTKGQAEAFLEDDAQSLETRYKPRATDDNESPQHVAWDLSNENIAKIVSRCRNFEATDFGSAALSEEQERELAPEVEEERQVERPPKMQAETHIVHPDLVKLVHYGHIEGKSTTFESAFKALRSTSAAKLFDLEQSSSFPTDLLVTADFMRTVKIPPCLSCATFISDSFQRPVQFILTTSSLDGAETTQHAILISPFEANMLQPIIRRTNKITLHLFAPRSNGGFASLDHLMLYNVGRNFTSSSVSRSLTTQLNLFAGSLYLRSLTEYNELCDFLGLLLTPRAKPGQQVYADGFIDPPAGKWGLKQSPVPFLRALLMRVRREGESIEKTHLGKLLSGVRLEEGDFSVRRHDKTQF